MGLSFKKPELFYLRNRAKMGLLGPDVLWVQLVLGTYASAAYTMNFTACAVINLEFLMISEVERWEFKIRKK